MSTQNIKIYSIILALGATMVFGFQNCSDKVTFSDIPSKPAGLGDNDSAGIDDIDDPDLEVCNGVSCDLTPITKKPAVTTILIALGDETSSQLVVNGASAQLIAENVVRYSSPVENPKILVVRDFNVNGEDPEDTAYAKDVLLARYNVSFLMEPASGLTASDVEGYDLVWFNNPGHKMGSVATRDVLINFKGAVVLQGDDLSTGNGFDLEALTGLRFVDNGTTVVCDGVSYQHDNNNGEKYRVSLDAGKIPGANASTINFEYGNDIDNTSVLRDDLQVMAVAVGGPANCTQERPAIVRYVKN